MAVAIYARKSQESEDRQVQSLEDQLTALRALANREGLVVDREILEAQSAKEPGTRPEFERLMADVRSGKVDGILVWQINRLSRNMVDGGMVSHLLQTGRLRFIRTPEKAYLPEDSALLMAIETGVATSFIQDLRRNVKRGMAGKVSRGWFPGPAPLGYVNNRLTKEIEPDPLRFHILKRGWDMVASGGSTVAEVRRELLRLGLTDTTGKAGITNGTAYRIFHNRFYAGEFRWGGAWHPGKHPAMVSADDFDRVRNALGDAPKTNDVELKHPYAGVFACPRCGCAITAETKVKRFRTTGTERRYTYYRCTGARGCSKASVTSQRLDEAIAALVERVRIDPATAEWARREVALSAERSALDDVAAVADLGRRSEALERRLGRLRELRIGEELTAEAYAAERRKAERELGEVGKRLATAKSLGEAVDLRVLRKLEILEAANGWDAMATAAKRTFLRSFSEKSFLTLERAEFHVDPLLIKIASIELDERGSQSSDRGDLQVSVSRWYAFWDDIRRNEADAVLSAPTQPPPGRIVVELPTAAEERPVVGFLGPAPPGHVPCADTVKGAHDGEDMGNG